MTPSPPSSKEPCEIEIQKKKQNQQQQQQKTRVTSLGYRTIFVSVSRESDSKKQKSTRKNNDFLPFPNKKLLPFPKVWQHATHYTKRKKIPSAFFVFRLPLPLVFLSLLPIQKSISKQKRMYVVRNRMFVTSSSCLTAKIRHPPSPNWQSSSQDSASRHQHSHRLSQARCRSPSPPASAA